jgi:hypothetical protein
MSDTITLSRAEYAAFVRADIELRDLRAEANRRTAAPALQKGQQSIAVTLYDSVPATVVYEMAPDYGPGDTEGPAVPVMCDVYIGAVCITELIANADYVDTVLREAVREAEKEDADSAIISRWEEFNLECAA